MMMSAPTFKEAWREEIEHWQLENGQRALLMAFCWCLKMRLDGVDPSLVVGPSRRDMARTPAEREHAYQSFCPEI